MNASAEWGWLVESFEARVEGPISRTKTNFTIFWFIVSKVVGDCHLQVALETPRCCVPLSGLLLPILAASLGISAVF